MSDHPAFPPPLWALWRNPIVVRCWRSRMRARVFVPWAIVTVVLATFLFLTVYNAVENRIGKDSVTAARAAFIPILVFQGILLLLTGTGAVTASLLQEEEEGMIEFQRLTPLPPAWKMVGYLFGLPVREYVLFALTLPFTLIGLWMGKLPIESLLKVYAVLFTSALLYHLTGYCAGFVIRARRFGARIVQAAVIVLYLALPQLSNFGYIVFEHLTVRPVFREQLSLPLRQSFAPQLPRDEKTEVAFYGLELPQFVFSLTIQGALILVFLSMIRRKWIDGGRHAIGKGTALGVLAGTAAVVLGNLLPLIQDGRVFPSTLMKSSGPGFTRVLLRSLVPKSSAAEAGMLVGLLSMVLLLLGVFLLLQILPTRAEAIRGWRRSVRLGRSRLPWRADEASALPWAAVFGLAAGAAVWIFGHELGVSRWLEGKMFALEMVPWVALLPVFAFTAVVAATEAWEKKGTFAVLMGFWVVPALVMLVLGAASDQGASIGFYLGALSPLSAPFCAMTATDAQWAEAGVHGHVAFFGGLSVQAVVSLYALVVWFRKRREIRAAAVAV
ncbi:MAG: hypothetical protein ACKO2G_15110 [Verrucomicrobiales bacterium]